MLIHLASDLHAEWGQRPKHVPPECDVIVLAGDIDNGTDGIQWAATLGKPVVYVAGNHCYYHHNIMELDDALRAEAAKHDHVHFLNGDGVIIDGVRFIGATLWTDFALQGDAVYARMYAQRNMNDFRLIRKGAQRFTPNDAQDLHELHRAYIEWELAKPFDGPTVVVSHHGCSPRSIHAKYAGDALNPAFVSNLEPMIERWEPELWLHGHIHSHMDYHIGKTRVVANPRGYPGELGTGFIPDLILEV